MKKLLLALPLDLSSSSIDALANDVKTQIMEPNYQKTISQLVLQPDLLCHQQHIMNLLAMITDDALFNKRILIHHRLDSITLHPHKNHPSTMPRTVKPSRSHLRILLMVCGSPTSQRASRMYKTMLARFSAAYIQLFFFSLPSPTLPHTRMPSPLHDTHIHTIL
jgi:hypothetical protein